MLHAVIMAGGSGTRFWPESRELRPKQLLDFTGGRTLIQATVDRLGTIVPPERVLIVTNHRQASDIAEQLPELPASAILGEPCKRDTAPCIGLAAHLLLRCDPDAIMAVMPSDHVIQSTDKFQQALAAAARLVEQSPRRLVTFGIKPTYPAESFGYIERGAQIEATESAVPISAFVVKKFREKPKADVARQFIESGMFYWNAGIFVWRARTILDELQQRQPAIAHHLAAIDAAWETPERDETLAREFAAIKGVSIDYAVMEHATDVVVIEAPFDWDDVGSWQALARLRGQDESGNTIVGRHVGVRTTNSIVRTDDRHLVATLGVSDLIIVHTPDATLVAHRDDEEAIRQIVQMLKDGGAVEYL